jgi:putative DNA primase/helicase
MLDSGWLYCKYETKIYRIQPAVFVSMRSDLLRSFSSDYPSAVTQDKKLLVEKFQEFCEQNEAEISQIIKDAHPASSGDDDDLSVETIEQAIDAVMRKFKLATFEDTDDVLFYETGIYRRGAEPRIRSYLEKIAEGCSNHLCEEVLGAIRRRTYCGRDEFDSDPHILNFKNCLVDISSGQPKKLDHSPSYRALVQLPVIYDEKADCPVIKDFLKQVLYEEDQYVIQEFVGYLLWKSYPSAKALMFIGEGANGKSTLISLIKALLGLENVCARSLQELEFNRFAKADLYGKLANLFADLPDIALKSDGVFKMITGGDPITAEHKFQNSFSFVNYAKPIFSTNKVPEAYDDSSAFFRRWILVTFPNIFEGDRADKNLLQKLTAPEEMSGFLNWALEGLERLRSNGWNFSNSKSTEEVREEYVRKSSPIKAFLMDCTLDDSAGKAIKQTLFQAFAQYCRTKKLPIVSQDTFFKRLPEFKKLEAFRPDIYVDGQRKRGPPCFTGIVLRKESNWGKESEGDESDAEVKEAMESLERTLRGGQATL